MSILVLKSPSRSVDIKCKEIKSEVFRAKQNSIHFNTPAAIAGRLGRQVHVHVVFWQSSKSVTSKRLLGGEAKL